MKKTTYRYSLIILARLKEEPAGKLSEHHYSMYYIVPLNMIMNYCVLANETLSPLSCPWSSFAPRDSHNFLRPLSYNPATHARKYGGREGSPATAAAPTTAWAAVKFTQVRINEEFEGLWITDNVSLYV